MLHDSHPVWDSGVGRNQTRANRIGIVWAQYGPYHFARVEALRRSAGADNVVALEFSNLTRDYRWDRASSKVSLFTLCPDAVTEQLPFGTLFQLARRRFAELGIRVCLLPSYWPKQSLAVLLAAKSLCIRTVMMNESHAGTARSHGVSSVLKRLLVSKFDSALVGGQPQKRYFASLGMVPEKIFTGYDAVDNDYFETRGEEIRKHAQDIRNRYALPDHYFLSLGRLIEKKNLSSLIRAFRLFLESGSQTRTHLVMVGAGDEEQKLKTLCHEHGLPVYEKPRGSEQAFRIENRKSKIGNGNGVHFYGFRQINETPIFYALADAFILPSLREEWGLVVNEAMASSLPVVVSETAGCAEDLLEPGLIATSAGAFSQFEHVRLSHKVRQNGFVFDPNSPEELSRILQVLESSPGTRSAMGLASRRIIARFSCENFAQKALLAAEVALRRTASRRLKPQNREQTGLC